MVYWEQSMLQLLHCWSLFICGLKDVLLGFKNWNSALGIAVDNKFQHISTDNLKIPGKKGVKKRLLDKLWPEDLGLHLSSNPNYSSRVCGKCALKIRNAVELVRSLKVTFNPLANIVKTSVECETQQLWKRYWISTKSLIKKAVPRKYKNV